MNSNLENDKVALEKAMILREKWYLGDSPINDFKSLVNAKGFLLLLFPTNVDVDGLTLEKLDAGEIINCIYANTNRPLGRVNFTIAHELYHILFEKSYNHKVTSTDFKDPVEARAEAFAGYFLIPQKHLINFLEERHKSGDTEIELETLFNMQKIYGVTFQAILYSILKLKKTEAKEVVPQNIDSYRRYFEQENWDKITSLIEAYDYDNKLNTVTKEFYLPKKIENIIRCNFQDNKVDKETASMLLDFFSIKL